MLYPIAVETRGPTIGMPYISALTYADLESLKHRRQTEARELSKDTQSYFLSTLPSAPTA